MAIQKVHLRQKGLSKGMIGTYWSDEISQSELEEVKSKGYNVEIKKYVEPEPRHDSMPF